MNILLANQPIRFGPLKFRGVQIILYQLHQTLLSAFFLLNFFYASRGSGHETTCGVELPACTCADSKCLPSKSCRKKISPVLMTEEFSEVLKIITFLLMVHVSLREGWFNCGAKSVCRITLFIYLFPQKSLHLGVYLYVRNFRHA